MSNQQDKEMRVRVIPPGPSLDFIQKMHQQFYQQQMCVPVYPQIISDQEWYEWINDLANNNYKKEVSMTVFDSMVEFLDMSYRLKDQIVPCLIGPVGIGKTEAVMQHCKNVNAGKVVKIVASQILPNEVSGLTMPNDDTRSMDIYDHTRLSSLEDGDILFFDELLEADQSVLKACLTLIESREMMSGKKLPDIQIVAATNPTIQSGMLADNVKQRFVFKEFEFRAGEVIEFIKADTGMDLISLASVITCNGNDRYNILTPRSLTKMARWACTIDDKDELHNLRHMLNNIWKDTGTDVGDKIFTARMKMLENPDYNVRQALREQASGYPLANNIDFDNADYRDIITVLTDLGIWDKIKDNLANIEMYY